MIIDQDAAKTWYVLTMVLAEKVANLSYEYLKTHKNIFSFERYPVLKETFPRDDPEFTDLYNTVPYLIYNIPKYHLGDFPKDKIQYGGVFLKFFDEDCVDCTQLIDFNELVEFIQQNTAIREMLTEKTDYQSLSSQIKYMINSIVERFLYITGPSVSENLREALRPFVIEKISRYVLDTLDIDIYVPLCLISFEDDNIELAKGVEIIRIPDDIQKSRQQACTYESTNENWIAACATHMLVLHNFEFENSKELSINTSCKEYRSYPLEIIDSVIAVLRIVTGYNLGYAQILTRPLGWLDSFCADLIPLYGSKSHFYNSAESKKAWYLLTVSKISHEQALKIQQLYSVAYTYKENDSKKSLYFALRRLNRCMLRNETDDIVTDATIGLEALLSGNSKTEISYTISNHIPVVFSKIKNELYTAQNSRAIMKQIYDYRSKIVHGSEIKDKVANVTIDEHIIPAEQVAVDFLRYTLQFILENIEYTNATEFDSYIDTLISR